MMWSMKSEYFKLKKKSEKKILEKKTDVIQRAHFLIHSSWGNADKCYSNVLCLQTTHLDWRKHTYCLFYSYSNMSIKKEAFAPRKYIKELL